MSADRSPASQDHAIKVPVPSPRTLCEACAKEIPTELSITIADAVERYISAYCPHNQVGAMFLPLLEQWRIVGPISRTEHQANLERSADRLEEFGTRTQAPETLS